MELVRKCPVCGKKIRYKTEKSYKRAIKENNSCRKCAGSKKRDNNIKRLLNEEIIDCYYIGFILADGHIEKNKRLQIATSLKDRAWIENFKKYIGFTGSVRTFIVNGSEECSIAVQDSENVPILCEKFEIKSNKTKYPPSIKVFNKLSDDKLTSLLIGFIDGDGSIKKVYKRNDCNISIKNHSSWLDILRLFDERINGKNRAKINNNGYATVVFSENKEIRHLKLFALENNLPILKRKWDKIDETYISRYEISDKNLGIIKNLADMGKTVGEICNETGLKYTTVYTKLRKNNIEFKKDEKKSNRKWSEQ